MFDNPFDSFHNAVAEAKEEREQLDRLLTISTPRERLLVIVIAVTIAVFAAWLFLGQITQSITFNGTLTNAYEHEQSLNASTQTKLSASSVWLKHEEVQQLSAGLHAVIEVTKSNGETITLGGKVSGIEVASEPGEMHSSEMRAGFGLYRLYVTSNEELDATSIRDRNCRIVVELEPQSPISLFGMSRA